MCSTQGQEFELSPMDSRKGLAPNRTLRPSRQIPLGLGQVYHLRAISLPDLDLAVGCNPHWQISEFIKQREQQLQLLNPTALYIHFVYSCCTVQPFPMSIVVVTADRLISQSPASLYSSLYGLTKRLLVIRGFGF